MKSLLLFPIFLSLLLNFSEVKTTTDPKTPVISPTETVEDCLSKKHGYVITPRSRVYKCSAAGGNLNTGCGNVMYEPQSVEFLKGYPKIGEVGPGPADGQLGGVGSFPELDEQNENRWHKEIMTSGVQDFYWQYTAIHRSTKFEYYITKKGWNPNKPLTRSAFETKPFTTIDAMAEMPPADDQMLGEPHEVTVPERQGYHIIYCVWEIDDTVNSFYSIIDADFQ